MKIYYRHIPQVNDLFRHNLRLAARLIPDGFVRILSISDTHKPFEENAIQALVELTGCHICFPAPDRKTFLLLSRHTDWPTVRCIRKFFRRPLQYRLYRGGIFNPNLPVRPFDAWYD